MTFPPCPTFDVSESIPLLILGASARAAAQSALRAGFQPHCFDAYADRDLRETGPVWAWPASTRQLVEMVATRPCHAWIFTGGLENRPGLVGRLTRRLPLWGSHAPVLRSARDPFTIQRLLREADLPALDVCRSEHTPPSDGQWLIKPYRGSGGRAIALWLGQSSTIPREPYYFQQRAEGQDISAVYLAKPGQVEWIGSTRQWSGLTSQAPAHAWHGNLVGEVLADEVRDTLHRIGQVLAARLGLRGLFGCDFRLAGTTPWLLEVNPRYTGSVELFEWALRRPLLREHAIACGFPEAPLPEARLTGDPPNPIDRCFAKRIVYATQTGVAEFPDDLPRWTGGFTPAPIADVPIFGQRLRPGDPICSILVSGSSPTECDLHIQEWLQRITRWIRPV